MYVGQSVKSLSCHAVYILVLKLIKMGVHPVLVLFGKCAVHAANGRYV